MRRYAHYWWGVKGRYCPTRIAVLDVEYDGAPRQPKDGLAGRGVALWSVSLATLRAGRVVHISQHGGKSAMAVNSWLSLLCVKRQSTWVFMPRCYDTLADVGYWTALERGEWQLCGRDWKVDRGQGQSGEDKADGLLVIEDPPTLISTRPRGTKGKILFLDVRNYGIGELEHGQSAASRTQLYMAGICGILSSLRTGQYVSLRGTAASQAVQTLRTRYDVRAMHSHVHVAATRLERAAYFGGRCECYRLGHVEGPVYHVDVRSMYAAIGQTLEVPVSLRQYHDNGREAERVGRARSGSVVADVSIGTGQPIYPCRLRGDVVYPVGVYRTCLAGPELTSAIAEGSITRWHSATEYTCAPVLAGFYKDGLAELTRLREGGHTLQVQWLKRVLNALPGKLAEPGRRWLPCPPRPEMGPYCQWSEQQRDGTEVWFRNVANNTQRLEVSGESYHSIPSIAAWITSAARVLLWRLLSAAGRQFVWYCDTDGFIVSESGYQRLLAGGHIGDGAPGSLRLVGAYRRCTIYGIRHYQLDQEIKCAGVRKGEIRSGETRPEYWDRVRAPRQVALGLEPGEWQQHGLTRNYEAYRHGDVKEDGTVEPLRVYDE